MNRPVWLTRLLTLGGVVETMAGLGLLLVPAVVGSLLLQSSLDAPAVVLGRIAGGGLLALGIACWCARTTPSAPGSLGVSWAFLVYNVIACVTLAWAGFAIASSGTLALGAAVAHGALGMALLGAFLGPAPQRP